MSSRGRAKASFETALRARTERGNEWPAVSGKQAIHCVLPAHIT